MYCIKGHKVLEGDKFCSQCGKKVFEEVYNKGKDHEIIVIDNYHQDKYVEYGHVGCTGVVNKYNIMGVEVYKCRRCGLRVEKEKQMSI